MTSWLRISTQFLKGERRPGAHAEGSRGRAEPFFEIPRGACGGEQQEATREGGERDGNLRHEGRGGPSAREGAQVEVQPAAACEHFAAACAREQQRREAGREVDRGSTALRRRRGRGRRVSGGARRKEQPARGAHT